MTTTPEDQLATPQAEDVPGVTAPTQAVEPSRRSGGLRWGIALAAVALIIGATAATMFLLSGSSTPSTVSGYVPTGSYVYAEARLDLPGDQRQGLANFLSHFPGFDDQAIFDQKIDEALDRLMGEGSKGEVTYTRDVKPWLGDSIALVGTGMPADIRSLQSKPPFLAIIATKDPAAAKTWLAAQATGTATTETYKGIEISVRNGDDAKMHAAWAVLDKVIVAGDLGSVRSAIDTGGTSSFASSDRFRAAAAAIPGEQTAFFFVDAATVMAAIEDMPGMEAIPADQLARLPAWAAGGLRFESDAIVIQSAMPEVEGLPAASDKVSELAPFLPADTIVALEGHTIGEYITTFIANLKSSPEAKASIEKLEEQAAMVGGLESFYSWIGDATVVVAGSGTDFDGGLVIKATDDAVLTGKVASIRNLLALAGSSTGITLSDQPYGDGTITTIDLGDAGDSISEDIGKLAYNQQRGLLVIGLETFVKSVVDTKAGSSLADQPRYRAAVDRVGEANLGQAFVDVSALVAAASSVGVPQAERATFDREYLPYLRPFSALATAGHAGDPLRSRTILIVQ